MVVTGYDDRHGCGYVLSTGADAAVTAPHTQLLTRDGVPVRATTELAASLRDALAHHPFAQLSWTGPEVPLTFDDRVLLAWLRFTVGGVLTVSGGPER